MSVEEIFRKWFGNASDTTGRAMTRHNVFQAMQEAVVEELKGAESLIESMKVANIKVNEELDEAENCANELQDKNEELKEELEKLRAELTTLKVDTTYDITNLTIEKEQLKAKNERLKNSFDEVFNQRNSIQSKNERLEDENGELIIEKEILYQSNLHYSEKNQKLREALDGIIDEVHTTRHDWGENMENIDRIAKEALKGGSDE